jgi:hypothetical protein
VSEYTAKNDESRKFVGEYKEAVKGSVGSKQPIAEAKIKALAEQL